MTTSGTTSFNMNLNDLVEEAFERCGAELRSGYDLRTARRSLNIMTVEWANRGINLWTIEEGSIPMVEGQIVYDLPSDTVDLLDSVIRTQSGVNQTDVNINRISADTYITIPNKNALGRPIQVWVNRRTDTPQISVWPAPNQSNYYTLFYYRLRRMQDAGNGINTPDIPFRFLPALVAGLAYHLALKIPGAMDRVGMLKSMYDEAWQQASEEDREKAPLRIAPRQAFI